MEPSRFDIIYPKLIADMKTEYEVASRDSGESTAARETRGIPMISPSIVKKLEEKMTKTKSGIPNFKLILDTNKYEEKDTKNDTSEP